MRLLFIAPNSNLKTGSELARIASGTTLEIVDGLIDRAGLDRALHGELADAIHFCGHGDIGVLQLNDGLIDAADFACMLDKQRNVKFFFINACDSLSLATALHNRFHVPCISNEKPINDDTAIRFAERFYREYRGSQDVHSAYDAAIDTLMRLYPMEAKTPVLLDGDMATQADIDAFLIYVRAEVQAMNTKLDTIKTEIAELKGKQGRNILIVGLALLVAQLATPWLSSLFH